jgi:hypothetical protein
MGSLVELKKDLEQIDGELTGEVFVLVELESRVSDQLKKVELLKKHKDKLQRALDILEDRVTLPVQEPPPPSEVEPVKPVPAAPIKKQEGPACQACGKGVMRPAYKRVPSGITVSMMMCDDSGCNNEVY